MNAISQIKIRLVPYLRALQNIFNYQIATKILLALWLFLLGRVFQILLRSTGRVAVTTGDWQFLFTTWQGIFILLLALISLTEGLYIPTFISSVIEGSFLYSAAAGIAVLVFLSVGIANMFILHGMVIDGLSIREAAKQSRKLIPDHPVGSALLWEQNPYHRRKV